MTTTIKASFFFSFFPSSLYSTMCYIDLYEWFWAYVTMHFLQMYAAWMTEVFLFPPSLNPGLLPSGGCPAVPGSSCRRPGGVRLRPRPGPQESPAAGRDGGGRHEVSPQRWARAIRPDARPLPPAFCHFLPNICRHSSRSRFTRRRSSWHRMKETGKNSVGK